MLRSLAARADTLLVGGGMAFTFLSALGHAIGDSLLDPDQLAACTELLRTTTHLMLPVDTRALAPGCKLSIEHPSGAAGTTAAGEAAGSEVEVFGAEIPPGWRGLDIGPATAVLFADIIASAGTVLWNGPMGVFEDERFAEGTRAVAEAVARCPGTTVVGGGDSVAALGKLGLSERIDHLSTGGGASLELLEFGDLPGLAALRSAPNWREASAAMTTDSSSRVALVSGNWKMHHTHYEAIQFVQKLAALLRADPVPDGTEVSLHPSFTSLRSVQTALESDAVPVALGAQNCHFEDEGAYTGEVSAEMLTKLNVRYVIVGHSERRATVRRHRRDRQTEAGRGAAPRDVSDPVRRRDPRGTASGTAPRRRWPDSSARLSRTAVPRRWRRSPSPTSRSGRSGPV